MILAFDLETTTWNKGHPFDPRNFIVCWSWATESSSGTEPWSSKDKLQEMINQASVLVVFNGKFDLQWLVKEGLTYDPTKVWDVQIAHFVSSYQRHRFPSLNEVCEINNLPQKPDKIREYWDKGVNTPDIPWDELVEYATHDAVVTLQNYFIQQNTLQPKQKLLIKLQSQDMSILREMEANGLPFDEELCQARAKELDDKISTLKRELSGIYPNVPINFGSNDHLSAFLYGGIVKEDAKEFVGYFKTGIRAGQPKYRNITIEHKLPRLYTPLPGSKMAKEGNFAVDEATLRKLKGKRKVIDMLLELSKLEKLNGTYYKGLIKLREERGWDKGIIHGNFNQTTAQTGRLSSNAPNLQNFASELQDIFICGV